MTHIDDVMQKVKGEIQQEKGKFHQATGDDVKGIVEKLKGKFNEESAEMKMNMRDKDKQTHDV